MKSKWLQLRCRWMIGLAVRVSKNSMKVKE